MIDAHTHVVLGSLEQALMFGVTTELDMFADPQVAADLKAAAAAWDDLADLRSAGTCATAGGGHPTGLVERGFYRPFPTIDDPDEAEHFVTARIAEGSLVPGPAEDGNGPSPCHGDPPGLSVR